MTIFGTILFLSTTLTSCGGSDGEKTNVVTIKPKSTSIKGDLGDYFEVIDKDYVIKKEEGSFMGGGIISVEVKRTDKDFDFPIDNINPFGTDGGEDYHIGFGIELLGESGPIDVKQATEGGMSGPYSSEDVIGLMKLKKGETGYIRWSVDKLDGLKSFLISSALQKEEHISEASYSEMEVGDCEQFCIDYEAFADEYVALLKKYKANPSDASIITEYSEMTSKAAEMQESSKVCAADAKTAARINKAVSKIARAAM